MFWKLFLFRPILGHPTVGVLGEKLGATGGVVSQELVGELFIGEEMCGKEFTSQASSRCVEEISVNWYPASLLLLLLKLSIMCLWADI